MKFMIDLQLFASKKGVSSTKNGRDSAGRRLGAKKGDGEIVLAGNILYRQRGTKVHPGEGTAKGGDDTIYALIGGVVKFERIGKRGTKVSVYAQAPSAK
jgi:large subunit ribosomal protein L27